MKNHPIPEEEADKELDGIFHEIKQVFRVSGVNLNFRTWATYPKFFPVLWESIRPVAETRLFEESSNHIRALAARLAEKLPRLDAATSVGLGESQIFQIQATLDLYHYINPKLLVISSVVEYACQHPAMSEFQPQRPDHELIPRGIPLRMYPMEMIDETPDDATLRRTFRDIQRTLGLPGINSDYRTLALWPEYLCSVWHRLKPVVTHPLYLETALTLREAAQQMASHVLPRLTVSENQLRILGRKRTHFLETTAQFTQLLPPLIINIVLISLDWRSRQDLERSPFPIEFSSPVLEPST
ncbi:halocarboxylic acid dehydrogenase DehI family protein [Nitrospira sp. T9]|uniref:halocarboxylic acid dehydrogenase DehI family protein n=1 Tax=unclassified Nitrospira TaxID=2652172 RepID=UPI003F9B2206